MNIKFDQGSKLASPIFISKYFSKLPFKKEKKKRFSKIMLYVNYRLPNILEMFANLFFFFSKMDKHMRFAYGPKL